MQVKHRGVTIFIEQLLTHSNSVNCLALKLGLIAAVLM